MKKIFTILLTLAAIFVVPLQSFADSNTLEIRTANKSLDYLIQDSLNLDHGVIYLEETYDYRIAFIVYDTGILSYSICYRNNPGVVLSGEKKISSISNYMSNNVFDCIENLLKSDIDEVMDFSARPIILSTISTTSEALNFASKYAPGWKVPTTSKFLGTYYGSKTVNIYEHVNGTATQDCVVKYYIGDTLKALASLAFGFNLTKLMKVVTNVYDATKGYIAQRNGSLTYFTIDNTRTKTARINGKTYYWAGWDKTYCVYSGDKATFTESTYDYAHTDYDYDNAYFGEKAIYSYNNG